MSRLVSVLARIAVAVAGAVVVLGLSPIASAPSRTPTVAITVDAGDGGSVASADGRVNCSTRCRVQYPQGALITFKAVPGPYAFFTAWTAGCVGNVTTCVISADSRTTVRASFTRYPDTLSVTVAGPGAVVSQPAGIACGAAAAGTGATCSATFPAGLPVALLPQATAGGSFALWRGACRSAPLGPVDACQLTPGRDVGVAAAFRRAVPGAGPQKLTVSASRYATITSQPSGIECPATCSASFPSGTLVTMTAERWSGDCVGAFSLCAVFTDAPTHVRGVVLPQTENSPPPPSLGINVTVSGPGSVVAGKINCSALSRLTACNGAFRFGTSVHLKALPGHRAYLRTWAGELCPHSRALTCTVPVVSSFTGEAVFARR